MNCQNFENIVSELARGQMMDAELRGEALAHNYDCEQCAARLRDEAMLTRGLQSVAAEMQSLSAPQEVEVKVLEAFRTQRVAPLSRRRSSSRYWVAAVAAVLLVTMAVVAARWRADVVDVPAPRIAQETEKKKEVDDKAKENLPQAVEDVVVKKEAPERQRTPARPRSSGPVNKQVASQLPREIATDFIPLRYVSAATLQDGGQIVRVELPRSTLASFGLPVNMDRYNEKVKADVLVGVDGLAHAIRFVQ